MLQRSQCFDKNLQIFTVIMLTAKFNIHAIITESLKKVYLHIPFFVFPLKVVPYAINQLEKHFQKLLQEKL